MTDKPALSKTRLEMLSRCGMQYYWRYVEGIIARPAVAMIEGTAVHQTIHENLIHKKERGELLPEEYITDLAADRLKTNWLAEDPRLDEDEEKLGEKLVRAESIDRSVEMARRHHIRLAPLLKPVYLERQFLLQLDGYPFNLRGAIDIQEVDSIRDEKTTRMTPTQAMADDSLQLDIYHFGAHVLAKKANEIPPERVMLDFMYGDRHIKTATFESTRDNTDHLRVLRRVETACKVIEAEAFMPTTPDDWRCSRKWCGYFDRCPFGAKRRTTVGQAGGLNDCESREV